MKSRKWFQSVIPSLSLINKFIHKKTFILVLVLLTSCLLVLPSKWLNPAEMPFHFALNGLAKVRDVISESIKGIFRFSKTTEKNRLLEDKILTLQSENLRLKAEIQSLNDRLDGLNYKGESAFTLSGKEKILANIIGFDSSNFRKSILIDKGTKHGVAAKMPVTWKNMVVGRIANANLWTSSVVLVSDPECKIPISILQTANKRVEPIAQGILEGTGDGQCRVKWIWHPKKEVHIDDKVVTSGILWNESPPSSAAFPKWLLVGTIVESSREQGDMFWHVTVEPAIDFSSLDSVFVILSSLRQVPDQSLTINH